MSEIQLQQLLQRTSSNGDDEEAMDMTVKDGVKMSKFDIRAIKIGSKVSVKMKTYLYDFNKKYVGKDSVFPEKNGAPRILEQFKDNPYTLELRDEYTTGTKPKKLPTAGATYYHGKPATPLTMRSGPYCVDSSQRSHTWPRILPSTRSCSIEPSA
jgi:hypothetical protein